MYSYRTYVLDKVLYFAKSKSFSISIVPPSLGFEFRTIFGAIKRHTLNQSIHFSLLELSTPKPLFTPFALVSRLEPFCSSSIFLNYSPTRFLLEKPVQNFNFYKGIFLFLSSLVTFKWLLKPFSRTSLLSSWKLYLYHSKFFPRITPIS